MFPHRTPEPASISATEAKNDFGRVLEKVISGGTVVITKHDVPKAVMISIEQYESLSRPQRLKMDALRAKYNDMLERMQAPGWRADMDSWFNMSPEELGKAAVESARKGLK